MASAYSTLEENEQKGLNRFFSKAFWRNTAYAGVGVVIISIIAAIVLILVLTYKTPVTKKSYSFDAMFDSSLTPNSFSAVWSTSPTSNQMLYWKTIQRQQSSSSDEQSSSSLTQPKSIEQMLKNNDIQAMKEQQQSNETCVIVSKDPASGKEAIIFDQSHYEETIPCGTTFTVSPDARYIAFKTEVEKVFRHSIIGKYLFFDTQSKKFSDVSPNANNKQKTLVWCPSGNTVAFVENNNIFVRKSPSAPAVQVTNDGNDELLFNGVTDWIYEEEVFGSVESFVWNQDCSKIGFLKLDESHVPVYRYEEYYADKPYPVPINIRIPNPGFPNPIPSVHVYHLDTDKVVDVNLGPVNTGDLTKDFYVYDLKFANETALAVIVVPRVQQKKQILLVNTEVTGTVAEPVVIRTETIDTWIQYAREVTFLSGHQFVDLIAFNDSYHIGLFNVGQEEPVKLLTSGPYEVTNILAFNQHTRELFYVSAEKGSTERHVYGINVDTNAKRALCNDAKEGYYSASFSSDANFYILNYQGPDLPYTLLKSIDESKNVTEKLVDNSHLKKTLNHYNIPTSQITTIKNNHGDNMNVLYVFPPEWTEGTEIQYPVLMYLYNGPGSQLVTKSYYAMHNSFSMYMASQGFIVATVDGRGTGFKGIDYMTCTYKNLGQKEVEDQIAAARVIADRADTDGARMSIWGWSYGGYMASKVISSTLNNNLFMLGVSVAPVTDWGYYDSAYTERYMQWPAINPAGYLNSSVISQIRDEKCPLLPTEQTEKNGDVSLVQSSTRFVLVHGTGDDNVHPLNSYNLMTELQNRQIQFETMFYPNKDHSIAGGATRRHLYRFLSNKIKQYVTEDKCTTF